MLARPLRFESSSALPQARLSRLADRACILTLSLILAGCSGAAPRGAMSNSASATTVQPPPVCQPAMPGTTALAALPERASLQGEVTPALAGRLQAAFDLAAARLPAKSVSVALALPGQGSWTASRGASEPLYAWASVGKQATAVVVLQLAEEGRLNLEDPVARWLPGVPNGEHITVRQLLAHTSGLYSANEARTARGLHGPMTLQEELAILARHGSLYTPGSCWRYSNSGYRLLGAVIERATGQSWQHEIQTRVIDRLGLSQMRVVTDAASLAGVALPVTADGSPALDLTEPGPAGAIVASAADMVRFEQALLDGELLKPESLRAMLGETRLGYQQGMSYGLGAMRYDIPDGAGRLHWIGHSGGGPGISAVVAYDLDRRAFVAVAVNGGGDAHAVANLLLRAMASAGR